jgi:hypothetical protein
MYILEGVTKIRLFLLEYKTIFFQIGYFPIK